MSLSSLALLAETTGDVADAGKAIALALGIGLGSLGAGIIQNLPNLIHRYQARYTHDAQFIRRCSAKIYMFYSQN